MQERIKEARQALGLTQTEFGQRIGVKGNTITGYERGLRSPSDAVITSICREFGISEQWLREGRGEMLVSMTEDQELARFFGEITFAGEHSFRRRLLRALSRMDDQQWAVLEALARELTDD